MNGFQLGAVHPRSSPGLKFYFTFLSVVWMRGIECTLVKFVGDTSLLESVDLLEDRKILERDMYKM